MRTKCQECKGTGVYVSPITAKESPCSLCSSYSSAPVQQLPVDIPDPLTYDRAYKLASTVFHEKDEREAVASVMVIDGGEDPDEYTLITWKPLYGEGIGIEVGGMEYAVLTEDEAERAMDAALESILDEPGMVPGADSAYFNREEWKRDAAIDGRGHYLSSYDGYEHEQHNGTEWLYIYRMN